MNIKWKIAIHIVITLIIGIAIGAMLNRAIVQKRIKHIVEMRAAGMLIPGSEKMFKPPTPEQEKLIREIFDKHRRQLADIHIRFSREIQSAFKSFREEIDPLLTPEQKKQFEKMLPGPPPFLNRPPDQFSFMRRPPSVEFELATLQSALDLSEDQAAKIKAVLEEFRDQVQSPMEKGMSPEKFDSFMKAEEKKDQEIEKILTNGQKERYRQLRRERPRRGKE